MHQDTKSARLIAVSKRSFRIGPALIRDKKIDSIRGQPPSEPFPPAILNLAAILLRSLESGAEDEIGMIYSLCSGETYRFYDHV